MKIKQVHLDLETLDTVNSARILSIGAVCDTVDFYVEVDTTHYSDDFSVSESTLAFWARQGGFRRSEEKLVSPAEAVMLLAEFITGAVGGAKDYEVWANSPSFDCSMLRHHYSAYSLPCPWQFWQERDVRTIKNTARELGLNLRELINPHHALQDAKNQKALVDSFYKTLRRDIGLARNCLEGVWPGLESDQHGGATS